MVRPMLDGLVMGREFDRLEGERETDYVYLLLRVNKSEMCVVQRS